MRVETRAAQMDVKMVAYWVAPKVANSVGNWVVVMAAKWVVLTVARKVVSRARRKAAPSVASMVAYLAVLMAAPTVEPLAAN